MSHREESELSEERSGGWGFVRFLRFIRTFLGYPTQGFIRFPRFIRTALGYSNGRRRR
jgi:hypothetical protein